MRLQLLALLVTLLAPMAHGFLLDNSHSWTVPESVTVGTTVGTAKLIASSSSTSQVSWQLLAPNEGPFAVNVTTGRVYTNAKLDFETHHEYNLELLASDGTQNTTGILHVAVLDVNEPPIVQNHTFVVALPARLGLVVGTVVAADPDRPPSNLTWFQATSNCSTAFRVLPLTGQVIFQDSSGSLGLHAVCALVVAVADLGAQSATSHVIIKVSTWTAARVELPSQLVMVPEDAPALSVVSTINSPLSAAVTWRLEAGPGACTFSVNSTTGDVVLRRALVYNVQPTYELRIVGEGPTSLLAVVVHVLIQKARRPPLIVARNFTVGELSKPGRSIGVMTGWDANLDEKLYWSIQQGSAASMFSIDPGSGLLQLLQHLNYETASSHVIFVQVKDSSAPDALSTSMQVTIHVLDVNEPPIMSSMRFSVPENAAPVDVGSLVASDPDRNAILTWALLDSDARWAVDNARSVLQMREPGDYEHQRSYQVRLHVCDNGAPALCDEGAVLVQIADVNEPHQVASATFHVDERSSVQEFGPLLLTDPDVPPNRVVWSLHQITPSTDAFQVDPRSGIVTVRRALDYEVDPKQFLLVLRAADSGLPALTADGTATVIVVDVNDPPVCRELAWIVAESVAPGTTVATWTADDEDSPAQQLRWSMIATTFSLTPSGNVVLLHALDFERQMAYSLTAFVSDGATTVECRASLSVSDVNEGPQTDARRHWAVPEDAPLGTRVGVIDAADPDHDTGHLTWQLASSTCGNAVVLDASSGVLLTARALDHEQLAVCSLDVLISDNGTPALSVHSSVTIDIEDVNEAPQSVNVRLEVSEATRLGTVIVQLNATDVDVPAQELTWTVLAMPQLGLLDVNPFNGIITLVDALDFEVTGSYELSVRVTDSGSPPQDTDITVTIIVVDANDAPTIQGDTWTVEESMKPGWLGNVTAQDQDRPAQQLLFELIASAGMDMFTVHPLTGVLSLVKALDYEKHTSHAFRIRVTDDGVPPKSSEAWFRVNVLDVNEAAPQLWPVPMHVEENVRRGTFVEHALVWDQDIYQHGTYQLVGGDVTNSFRITENYGRITTFRAPNFENVPRYWLQINITDDGSPQLSAVRTQVVDIVDVNEVPESHYQHMYVREDAPVGTEVGHVEAFDIDHGQVLLYTAASGDAAPLVLVHPATGIVSLNATTLNYEAKLLYMLVVNVSDSGTPMLWNESVVAVHVVDANDAPLVSRATLFIDECPREVKPEAAMLQTTSPIRMWDVDTPEFPQLLRVTHSRMVQPVRPADGVIFAVNETGYVHLVNSTLDFERHESYHVELTVMDSHNVSSAAVPLTPQHQNTTVVVEIRVRDLNEKAVVIAPNLLQVAENSPIGTVLEGGHIEISDPDNQVLRLVIDDSSFKLDHVYAPRFANLTRLPFTVKVARTKLPAGGRILNVVAVDDSNPSKSSDPVPVFVSVDDVNDPPEIVGITRTYPSVLAPTNGTVFSVPEATPVDEPLVEIMFDDPDPNQLLTATVKAPYDTYIAVTVEPEPVELLRTNGPYKQSRRAKLMLLKDFLDFETVDTHVFTVCVRDDGRLRTFSAGGRVSFSFTASQSACATFQLNVTDVHDPPSITGISIPSEIAGLNTIGGEYVQLYGRNLGPAVPPAPGVPMYLFADYSNGNATFIAAACVVKEAYVHVECRSVVGYGKDHVWLVALGRADRRQTSPRFKTKPISYALPVVSAFDGDGALNAPTHGGLNITIFGNQFGSTQHQAITGVWYGPTGLEYTATECLVMVDHSQIQCVLAAGVGSNLQWTVEVAYQKSKFPTTSYGPPAISGVQLLSDKGTDARTMNTAGRQTVRLTGTNFGRNVDNAVDKVVYGRYGMDMQQWSNAKTCRVVQDHTEIQCTTVEGSGVGQHWLTAIKGQASAVSDASLDYSPPSILRVVQASDRSDNMDTSGKMEVLIIGDNFGAPQSPRAVSFNGRLVATGLQFIDGGLRFLLPAGEGVGKALNMTVDGQLSNVVVVNYTAPQLTTIQLVSGYYPNPITLRIVGRNFGLCCHLLRSNVTQSSLCPCIAADSCACVKNGRTIMTINKEVCDPLTLLSDTEATCVTNATEGDLRVTTAHGVHTMAYRYDSFVESPRIDNVTCNEVECKPTTSGGDLLTLHGANFNLYGTVRVTLLGPTGDSVRDIKPKSYSNNAVTFRTPAGQSELRIIVSVMGESRKSEPFVVKYAPPVITAVNVTSGPTIGGTALELRGRNFGSQAGAQLVRSAGDLPNDQNYNRVLVGTADCIVVTYTDTRIVCLTPEGAGAKWNITVRVARFLQPKSGLPYLMATAPQMWSYESPRVLSLVPNHTPTVGGAITIVGWNFGPVALQIGQPDVRVAIDSTQLPSADVTRLNHTAIMVRVPIGIGQAKRVEVIVKGQTSGVEGPTFSYDAPIVTALEVMASESSPMSRFEFEFPAPMDGFSSRLTLRGRNFGVYPKQDPKPPVVYLLPGRLNVQRIACADVEHKSDNEIQCRVASVPVSNGWKYQLAAEVLGRAAQIQVPNVTALCIPGYYVIEKFSPLCTTCPQNANCTGGFNEPAALAGYWADSANKSFIKPCFPAKACLPNNKCADGYDQDVGECKRCWDNQYQVVKYYRAASGDCNICDNNSTLILIGLLLAACVVGMVLYFLYKKAPSVAAFSIFLDYLQIMSIFSDLDLKWPLPMVQVFQFASATAMNIDVASPECAVTIPYMKKWLVMESVPLMLTAGLAAVAVADYVRKVLICRKGSKVKHVDNLIGWWLISINFCYMMVVRQAFKALSCTTGDGGKLVLLDDPKVDCNDNSYMIMKQLAYAAIAGYGVGIPLLYSALLFPNGAAIRVDQTLRLKGQADSRALNPFYGMQKRLRRLYYKFKPDKYYWTVVILARKMAIIVISATTVDNPLLAASSTALVLFAAYSSHVRSQPYLHDEHDPHAEIAKVAMAGSTRALASVVTGQAGPAASAVTAQLAAISPFLGGQGKTRYLFDANLLESTCLACSIGLLMAGIMVKSYDMTSTENPDVLTWIMVSVSILSAVTCVVAVTGEIVASVRTFVASTPGMVQAYRRQSQVQQVSKQLTAAASRRRGGIAVGSAESNSNNGRRRSTLAQVITKTFTPKEGVHHQLVLRCITLRNIQTRGVFAGTVLKVRIMLHPQDRVLTMRYDPDEERSALDTAFDVWFPEKETLHVVVSGPKSKIIGFSSIAAKDHGYELKDCTVDIRDVRHQVVGRLFVRIALVCVAIGEQVVDPDDNARDEIVSNPLQALPAARRRESAAMLAQVPGELDSVQSEGVESQAAASEAKGRRGSLRSGEGDAPLAVTAFVNPRRARRASLTPLASSSDADQALTLHNETKSSMSAAPLGNPLRARRTSVTVGGAPTEGDAPVSVVPLVNPMRMRRASMTPVEEGDPPAEVKPTVNPMRMRRASMTPVEEGDPAASVKPTVNPMRMRRASMTPVTDNAEGDAPVSVKPTVNPMRMRRASMTPVTDAAEGDAPVSVKPTVNPMRMRRASMTPVTDAAEGDAPVSATPMNPMHARTQQPIPPPQPSATIEAKPGFFGRMFGQSRGGFQADAAADPPAMMMNNAMHAKRPSPPTMATSEERSDFKPAAPVAITHAQNPMLGHGSAIGAPKVNDAPGT